MRAYFTVSILIFFFSLTVAKNVSAADIDHLEADYLCHGSVDIIKFKGNESTDDSVLRQEVTFSEISQCSVQKILESRQNMMDLGLFSSVEASLEQNNEFLELLYTVKEKHYILPIPRISRTSDGELRVGIQLRMDNVFGYNHKLKLTSEKHAEDDGAGRTGFEHSFSYAIPHFQNSRFGSSVKLVHLEKQFELKRDGIVYGESNRSNDKIELGLKRRRTSGAGSRGWKNSYMLRYEVRGHELKEGQLGPFEAGNNVRLSSGITYNQVKLGKYRREGYVTGGVFSFGTTYFGGDYDYQRLDAFYRGFIPLEAPTLTNFNYNFEFGYSNGTPFGERAFSIGGADILRGVAGKTMDGDVKLVANFEYLSAIKHYPSIRWVLFWDIANVFPRWDFKPARTENGLGVGLRWKIVSFVKLDLRIDYAVSLSEKEGYAYFATKLNF